MMKVKSLVSTFKIKLMYSKQGRAIVTLSSFLMILMRRLIKMIIMINKSLGFLRIRTKIAATVVF